MTVSTLNTKHVYDGDGSNIYWPYTFQIEDPTDIHVYLTDSNGGITELTSNFSVDDAHSRVIYPTAAAVPALALGAKITISRENPLTQETELDNQGVYGTQAVEDALDKLTMIVQKLKDDYARAVKLPVDSVESDPDIQTFLDSFQDFRGLYYGGLPGDPALDPNGNAIDAGDMYYDTTLKQLKIYDGGTWAVIALYSYAPNVILTAPDNRTFKISVDYNPDGVTPTMNLQEVIIT